MQADLEHINLTVTDADATARFLCDIFGWRIRWRGKALNDGFAVHVGGEERYLALYSPGHPTEAPATRFAHAGSLNHVGLTVGDLDAAERRVRELGYTPHSHADYEPGRRFYFDGPDGVEYELVCYS